MKRRVLLALSAAVGSTGWLVGCAHAGRGETASYALYNGTKNQAFEMAQIVRVGDNDDLSRTLVIAVPPPNDLGWRGGGPLRPGDTGHRVPDRVEVSWRLSPRADQKRYEGDLIGPYEIELRSRIPSEVLEAAKQPGAILETAVSVGVVPIQVRWQLVRPNEQGRLRTVRKGGDW